MKERFRVLDGWRGISILFVLAGHLFPVGPKSWGMNGPVAASGMAIFFILSGFLITTILMRDPRVGRFLIRRVLRIVPLAWLVLLITFLAQGATAHAWLSSFFYYANWPPMGLTETTSHFWSLCVEMQFYLLAAMLVICLRKHFYLALPVLCVAVTGYRVWNDTYMSIATYFRLDEILAGCVLAILHAKNPLGMKAIIRRLPMLPLLALLVCSAYPSFGALNYARPYIALLLVGTTLFQEKDRWYKPWLEGRFLLYFATTSYALYVIHGGLRFTWLGEGDTLVRYAKRPLFLFVTFGLAHLSTKYYESYWINLGRRLTQSKAERTPQRSAIAG